MPNAGSTSGVTARKGQNRPLLLVSGPRGVGKSVVCRRTAENLRREGWSVAGVITEVEDTRRFLVDLATGERRLLAAEGDALEGPVWGRYAFCQAGLDWGNTVIAQAISAGADLVVLDEVGPVELVREQGLTSGLNAILGSSAAGLVVVRPALLDRVRTMVPRRPVAVWSVTLENREHLPAQITSWLLDRENGVV
jgi:nucleoside-triphosphatase THEP1